MLMRKINLFILISLTIAVISGFSMVAKAESDIIHYTTIHTNGEEIEDGGMVSPSGFFKVAEKIENNLLSFTITPNAGYVLSELKYNDNVVVFSGNNPYTFTVDTTVTDISVKSKLDVYFETEVTTPPTVTTYSYGYNSLFKDIVTYNDAPYNRITLFGLLNPNGYTSFKYGVIFKIADASYETNAAKEMIVGAAGITKYPAQSPYILPYYIYGVSLLGPTLDEGMFYIRPYVEYAENGETKYSYGRVVNTILQIPDKDKNTISSVGTPLTNTENIGEASTDNNSETDNPATADNTTNNITTDTTSTDTAAADTTTNTETSETVSELNTAVN